MWRRALRETAGRSHVFRTPAINQELTVAARQQQCVNGGVECGFNFQHSRGMAYMKRRQRGLYGPKEVRFGNNVSHSVRRTRRMWKPNVQVKRIYSETLDEMIRLRVTTHVLRCIDKLGGLDNYILSKKRKDQDSVVGENLKTRIETILRSRAEGGCQDSIHKLQLAKAKGFRVA